MNSFVLEYSCIALKKKIGTYRQNIRKFLFPRSPPKHVIHVARSKDASPFIYNKISRNKAFRYLDKHMQLYISCAWYY